MKLTIRINRPWPDAWARVIVIIVFVLTWRWAPAAAVPFGLGSWLATQAARPRGVAREGIES